jgi:hypothetical protein
MDPFRDTSIHAAWRADYSEHFPLSASDVRRLRELPHRRERDWVLRSFAMLFGGYQAGREAPDALGLRPFTPPF